MKRLQIYLMVALLSVAAACTLFKKDIEVPQSFSLKIMQSATDPLDFTESVTLNNSNPDIEKYKNDIDVLSIDKITYRVSQFDGANTPVVTGTLKYAADGTGNFETLGTISGLNLKTSNAAGTEYTLNLDNSVKDKLAELMKSQTDVVFRLEAASTSNPVDATIEFEIHATMTVEI